MMTKQKQNKVSEIILPGNLSLGRFTSIFDENESNVLLLEAM